MDAHALIRCWELGRRRHPLDRGLLLFAAAEPYADVNSLADRTLGERNAALLRLRRELFGDELKACVSCPECGERLEFSLSAAALLERAPDEQGRAALVDVGGFRLRLPTTRDLAEIVRTAGDADDGEPLFRRLVIHGTATRMAALEHEIDSALDAADPCMDFGVDLTCPACSHEWNADFDVPTFLWDEVDSRARRLLDEVHALARSYGWSERQVLELSDTRRAAYLERVLA